VPIHLPETFFVGIAQPSVVSSAFYAFEPDKDIYNFTFDYLFSFSGESEIGELAAFE